MLNLTGWKLFYIAFLVYHSSVSTFSWRRTRFPRDTYDEREKLLSTYKIMSKSQCLLQMRSIDGYVFATHGINFEENDESRFLFLPVAVNLFLIQHEESRRYLCARQNYLVGSLVRDDRYCLFESKRSDIDFGLWDSFHLFYEENFAGYLSISNRCQTRIRRKFLHDPNLNSFAFVRINTDRTKRWLTTSVKRVR